MIDDIPLDEEQLKVVGLLGVVVLAMVGAPMLLSPSDQDKSEPNNGTIVTPDGTTLEEVDGADRGPLDGLNALPASHLRDDESPTVHASTGAQTMRVETTTVDGEPALELSDDRTHDGRWVAVPTEWFNRTQGGVPSVARIAHEENGTYTEAIQVRGDSAAFYVRGFSTNTVTFGGELVIRDRPAVDGTRHTYQLDSSDSVENLVINATGATNTKWDNRSGTALSGKNTSVQIGGNADPLGPNTSQPLLRVTGPDAHNTANEYGEYYHADTWITPSSNGYQTFSVPNMDVSEVMVWPFDGTATVDVYLIDGSSQDISNGEIIKKNLTISGGENVFYVDNLKSVSNTATIAFVHKSGDDIRGREDNNGNWKVELRERPVTDVSATIGSNTVEFGNLSETPSENNINLSTGENTIEWAGSGAPVVWELIMESRSRTIDPVVELNGNSISYSGTLADGETVDLGGSVSWLEDGQNNITVHVGDGSYSGDGPEPQVDIEFRHGLESPRTVQYESEALSERYNISKTYTTARANASLTIPHARTVVSMRALDYRLNETGSWSSVPEAAANLSGTTLTVDVSTLAGDPVPEATTVEVRSTGSRVDAHESEISVVQATPVGFDMNSRIRLDTWGSGSYLEVGETPQSGLVYYAENESYSAESDYVELYSNGDQRFYAPNASSGSELTLQTLSARVSPERNSMRVRVPESANATNTEFVVEPASVVGDSWTAEYVAGTDGQWYAVVDSAGDELGAAEKPSPIEVDRDDVGLVSIVETEPPSASTDGAGGGIFATVTTGNLPSLLALFGSVGMLFVAGRRPGASRDAIDGVASGVDGVVSRVPRVGPAVGGALESAVSGAGSALVSVGENRLLTGAVGAAVALAAAQAGLFSVGPEAGAIISVAGIAVGSLYLLREAGEFTTARWIAIVGVAGVVALQGLGEGDLLAQFVNSDAFLIAVLFGGYAVIQLVREYRQNNSPDDDRPQVIVGGRFRSGDDEGSD